MKIIKVSLDDWEAYYCDGKLMCEGHSVNTDDLLDSLGIDRKSFYIDNEELDEFSNCFPRNYRDFQEYIKRTRGIDL